MTAIGRNEDGTFARDDTTVKQIIGGLIDLIELHASGAVPPSYVSSRTKELREGLKQLDVGTRDAPSEAALITTEDQES